MVQLINNFSLACVEEPHQNARTQLNCVCDFRINENNCVESYLLRTGSWILIPYTSFIAITSILFLWYRIYIKGQSLLFPPSRERGIVRPRPHDAFHLVTASFSLLHIVRLLLLKQNAYPNSIWAEIMEDLPRQASFSFSVLYLVGISKCACTSYNIIDSGHMKYMSVTHIILLILRPVYSIPTLEPSNFQPRFVPNKYLIDVGSFFLIFGPYIINTPISYFIGYYADFEETPVMSIKLFTIKYLIWVFWLSTYLSSLLYFWHKLLKLLQYHMRDLRNRPRSDFTVQWKYETLQIASKNLSTVVMAFAFLGSMYIIVYFMFGFSFKTWTKRNNTTNVIYFVILNFVEPICLQIAQFIIVYNAIRPSPFGKMLSVVRRPISTETTKSPDIRKNSHSDKSKSERSVDLQPEVNEPLQLDYFDGLFDFFDFFAGEIPIEHQNTRQRCDSSIGASSIASTAYFSTTQSVHSKNDSLHSLKLPNSRRASKGLSPQRPNLNSDGIGSGDEIEISKRDVHSSLFPRNLQKEDSLRDGASINEK